MNPSSSDFVIIGAGPAGEAAAYMARARGAGYDKAALAKQLAEGADEVECSDDVDGEHARLADAAALRGRCHSACST